MSVDELTRELERLRADVKALEASRESSSGDEQRTADAAPVVPPDPAPAFEASVVAGAESSASAGAAYRAASHENVRGCPAGDAEGGATSAATEPVVDPKLRSQIEELGDLLHDELKNMPAVTSLTVFALGILLGRFLR